MDSKDSVTTGSFFVGIYRGMEQNEYIKSIMDKLDRLNKEAGFDPKNPQHNGKIEGLDNLDVMDAIGGAGVKYMEWKKTQPIAPPDPNFTDRN